MWQCHLNVLTLPSAVTRWHCHHLDLVRTTTLVSWELIKTLVSMNMANLSTNKITQIINWGKDWNKKLQGVLMLKSLQVCEWCCPSLGRMGGWWGYGQSVTWWWCWLSWQSQWCVGCVRWWWWVDGGQYSLSYLLIINMLIFIFHYNHSFKNTVFRKKC